MTDETPTGREPSNDGPSSAVEAPGRPGAYPTDTLPSATLSGRYSDDALEAGLRRVLTAINGLPPKVDVRPDPGLHTHDIADTIPGCVDCAARAAAEARRDFEQLGCSVYPEGDGRHDYRKTAPIHHGSAGRWGYESVRCASGVDGCDDKACICLCHSRLGPYEEAPYGCPTCRTVLNARAAGGCPDLWHSDNRPDRADA